MLERCEEASSVEFALSDLRLVSGFIYSRVGNRADAEELTQEVALKALPRLRANADQQSVRAYLFAAARSVLASFWSNRLRLPVAELRDQARSQLDNSAPAGDRLSKDLDGVLASLRPDYRRLLELRYLRGYTLPEVAHEMGKTTGAVKVMQGRALRMAAAIARSANEPEAAWQVVA